MKTIILLSALVATQAFAARSEIECHDKAGNADQGYSVLINKNNTQAKVFEMTFVGARQVAELVCSAPEKVGPSHPDAFSTDLVCYEPDLRDAGYSLTIQSGGIAGITTGTLSEISFMGSTPVASLICR